MWTRIGTFPCLDLQTSKVLDLGKNNFPLFLLNTYIHYATRLLVTTLHRTHVRLHGGAGRVPGKQALLLGQVKIAHCSALFLCYGW